MRLIDADKLIVPDEKSAKCLIVGGRGGGGKTLAMAFNVARQRIADAPTIDAVPVVRCKDCEHFAEAAGKDSGKPCGYGQCKLPMGIRGIVCADDYCSFGERKDGE